MVGAGAGRGKGLRQCRSIGGTGREELQADGRHVVQVQQARHHRHRRGRPGCAGCRRSCRRPADGQARTGGQGRRGGVNRYESCQSAFQSLICSRVWVGPEGGGGGHLQGPADGVGVGGDAQQAGGNGQGEGVGNDRLLAGPQDQVTRPQRQGHRDEAAGGVARSTSRLRAGPSPAGRPARTAAAGRGPLRPAGARRLPSGRTNGAAPTAHSARRLGVDAKAGVPRDVADRAALGFQSAGRARRIGVDDGLADNPGIAGPELNGAQPTVAGQGEGQDETPIGTGRFPRQHVGPGHGDDLVRRAEPPSIRKLRRRWERQRRSPSGAPAFAHCRNRAICGSVGRGRGRRGRKRLRQPGGHEAAGRHLGDLAGALAGIGVRQQGERGGAAGMVTFRAGMIQDRRDILRPGHGGVGADGGAAAARQRRQRSGWRRERKAHEHGRHVAGDVAADGLRACDGERADRREWRPGRGAGLERRRGRATCRSRRSGRRSVPHTAGGSAGPRTTASGVTVAPVRRTSACAVSRRAKAA